MEVLPSWERGHAASGRPPLALRLLQVSLLPTLCIAAAQHSPAALPRFLLLLLSLVERSRHPRLLRWLQLVLLPLPQAWPRLRLNSCRSQGLFGLAVAVEALLQVSIHLPPQPLAPHPVA